MKFSVEKKEQYTIFSLNEENLNSLMAPLLKSEFIILRNEGQHNLIFDLSDVKFVDSSGLSAILTATRLWKDFGSFVITGVNHPSVKKLIEISRLDSVLEIIPTIQESIDFVMMEELERELKGEAETDDTMQ
ncbi:MAG: STAS domain-containing protein [Bacteroidota bacterium]